MTYRIKRKEKSLRFYKHGISKMTYEFIFNEIKKLIISVSEQDLVDKNITENTNLVEDLNFDSIQIIRLIVEIEQQFNVYFDMEIIVAADIFVYKNFVQYVYNLLNETLM